MIDQEEYLKISFDPISNPETRILILGSIPGDKSLEMKEYYGHPRNRFWKIISIITKNELPSSYDGKIQLLLNAKIGLWDIAQRAIRKGSLDSAIKNEHPNDLETFIKSHPQLSTIAFNGSKSEALYKKYFKRNENIQYVSLPSTSPANATMSFEEACKKWEELLKYR